MILLAVAARQAHAPDDSSTYTEVEIIKLWKDESRGRRKTRAR